MVMKTYTHITAFGWKNVILRNILYVCVCVCHIKTINANRDHGCAEEQEGVCGVFEGRRA